ncbi:hypothetical protein [Paraburkholderia bryophila]|uniref:U1 small nuclear ribonucleoprotein of 70kDa N-terminal domain-containing protein n=1 Tax=Paraburkholderia bryophila TaxID=420952 RepID=A0A7Y9W4G8_9BURK|nr:hypothetical protein [Paraburkholderia bryophila]NYH13558.1 hypothetical protein [Paraburkholderia bryophila]
MFKTCPHCQIIKTADQFHRDRQKSDGLSTYCRECRNEMNREAYQQLTTEQRRARNKATYEASREWKLKRQSERYHARKAQQGSSS